MTNEDPLMEFARAVEDSDTQRSVPTSVLIQTLLASQGEHISELRESILRGHRGISAAEIDTALRTAVRTGLVEIDPVRRDPMVRLTATGQAIAGTYSQPI